MTLFGEAKRELQTRPLVAFDHVLRGLAEAHQVNTELSPQGILTLSAEAILGSLGIHPVSPLDELFSQGMAHANRRFVAGCLLRLLAANNRYFDYGDFRIKAFRLFDEIFSVDLYPQLRID